MVKQFYVDYTEKALAERLSRGTDYSDSEFMDLVDSCVDGLSKKVSLSESERREIADIVFCAHRKLGILQPLLDDPLVNEIMINGTDNIYIERGGQMELYDKRFSDASMLFNVIQSMVSWIGRSVNESSPIVDTRLQDGSRVNIVLKPVALNGPVVTVRKFPDRILTIQDLEEGGCISEEEALFLRKCVEARVNIFVSGGTSSGKTTFLNILSGFVPPWERIVTVEDSAELRLSSPNIVRLETKESDRGNAITMRMLIKASLRMRPDRIIVGEVRDMAALDMLQAMCTGHDGSMSTAHANSAEDVVTRLETMALWEGNINSEAIRRQIASGLDLVVHMQRDSSMKRYVAEICVVEGIENGNVALRTVFKDGVRVGSLVEGERVYEKIKSAGRTECGNGPQEWIS
ncbi:MAG: CpaF family protein [Clostridia bacterium]|nr:CpaF family protein [Clostridia bacterium]